MNAIAPPGRAVLPRRPIFLFLLLSIALSTLQAATRPNIIWIVGEDTGPELHCYGDPQAITPNLDRLAAAGA